ncbi:MULTISPECIES: ComC/BlpC family leader-containing pheromone/bacteriocin [unclassified Siphonobacter]|nr:MULTISPECIES: ComC/BlpC family leader-containing pheromone/bacteriocin [unclassified Siphonobacter]
MQTPDFTELTVEETHQIQGGSSWLETVAAWILKEINRDVI